MIEVEFRYNRYNGDNYEIYFETNNYELYTKLRDCMIEHIKVVEKEVKEVIEKGELIVNE